MVSRQRVYAYSVNRPAYADARSQHVSWHTAIRAAARQANACIYAHNQSDTRNKPRAAKSTSFPARFVRKIGANCTKKG
eukprot:41093-Rhodomonas_salina.1